MIAYLIRRALIGLVTLGLITLVVYALVRAMPGDPLSNFDNPDAPAGGKASLEIYREMQHEMGLDRDWFTGYLEWLGDLLRGDLGRSLVDRLPVAQVIGARIGPTLLLSGTALFLSYLISIPLGIYCGARSGGVAERSISTVLYLLYSLPAFVAALYLLVLFSVELDWLPLSGMRSGDEAWDRLSAAGKAWDLAKHLLLPVTAYTYGSLAYSVRFIRSNLQEAIRQDYVRTARAKGLPERTVIVHHAFRNTLIPLVTHLGLTLPALLSGSVILEQIFGWRGMGRLFLEKIATRDYPVIMGLVLISSILVLIGNLLADVLYAVVDPRVSYT